MQICCSSFGLAYGPKPPRIRGKLLTVAISSFRDGGEFGASKFHRSRKSSTASIVWPQFTASVTARISIGRLAALFQNCFLRVHPDLYQKGPAPNPSQPWLTYLRQSRNCNHCCQGNQHEPKYQCSWSLIYGCLSILVFCPENATASPLPVDCCGVSERTTIERNHFFTFRRFPAACCRELQ